jgi:lysylphosphatidylglycerol synthetase-like protein (DUF2156 family)
MQEDTARVLQAIVKGLEDELQWPDAEKRQQLAPVFPGMFSGCIGVTDVKEYQVFKYLDPVKERRSWSGKRKLTVTSYCLLWITLVITFLHAYVWERMIMKCLLVVLYIYRRVNFSLKIFLWLQMVHLRVIVIYAEVSRIQGMMK